MPEYTLTLSISSESAAEIAETVEALGKSVASLERPGASTVTYLAREASASTDLDRVTWYRLNARRFLDELTPDAGRALLYIADHAPAVGIRTMADALGLGTGTSLAGKMASIGWAVRRLDAPAAPFERIRDRYEIEPEVAEALRAGAIAKTADRRRARAR
jgi:hypothetical protein